MKKETRYEMLGHIDQKYLDEAYPKKRNLASILIPVAACACLIALLAPTVITALRPETAVSDGGISNNRLLQIQEQEYTPPSTTIGVQDQITAPDDLPSDEYSGDGVLDGTADGALIHDPRCKEYYLSRYNSLILSAADGVTSEGSFIGYEFVGYEGTDSNSIFTMWDEVCEYYGKDLSPNYLPAGLKTPTEAGKEQLWSVFQVRPEGTTNEKQLETIDKVQMYYFENYLSDADICPNFSFLNKATDEFNMDLNYYIHDVQVPKGHFTPSNRGVYIVAESTNYTDITETMLYRILIENAQDSTSYYNGVPIVFYVDSKYSAVCGYDSGSALTVKNDSHLSEEYKVLLEDFLSNCLEEGMDLQADGWSYQNRLDWNDVLVENGFPAESADGVTYHAALVCDGVMYKLSSNLDFETFAAITASLIE